MADLILNRRNICLGASALALSVPALSWAAPDSGKVNGFSDTYRYLASLEPEVVDYQTLRINRGSITDTTGETYYYNHNGLLPPDKKHYFDININQNGAGGLDTGSPVHLNDYFVWIIRENSTDELSALFTHSTTTTGVVIPPSYSLVRKLPYGFVYRTDWGGSPSGIPPVHMSGWPRPYIRFTGFQNTAAW